MTTEDPVREEVAELVRGMNQSWLAGRVDELDSLFHPDVVMVPPAGGERVVGRGAMVESFRQYLASVVTHDFEELGLTVDRVGDTAIASLRFRVRYEVGGEVYDEVGTDLLVFARADGRWQIIWRTQRSE